MTEWRHNPKRTIQINFIKNNTEISREDILNKEVAQ